MLKKNNAKTKALKEATLLYKVERAKMEKGEKHKGAGELVQVVNKTYKNSVLGWTVWGMLQTE